MTFLLLFFLLDVLSFAGPMVLPLPFDFAFGGI
jgi:hypothetical protein